MKTTKQYIKDHALKLFNQSGFVNVRLQHIADAAFSSVGHLAYHFKNKDSIINELYDDLKNKQELMLNEYRVVPLFEDIHAYLIATFEQQQKHIFFYTDTIEVLRAYPEIEIKHEQYIKWQLSQLNLMLAFNASRGALISFSSKQQHQLAWQIRSITDMWQYIKKVEGKKDLNMHLFLDDIWSIISPFFTDMGLREYQQLNHISLNITH